VPSRVSTLLLAVASAALVLSGGPPPAPAAPAAARIAVVAAENFYGDIAGQLGRDPLAVTSIISDPNVDPHEYESSAKDAAAVADARLVIQNGLGYDAFMDRLMKASPNPQRRLIVVSDLTGHRQGDNVHIWYDPPTIPKVAQTVYESLLQIDPGNAGPFRERYRAFQSSLPPLTQAIDGLKAQYAGTPVAATEPVFGYMAHATGLEVITPLAFQKAIEEGHDPPAAALAQMEDQLKQHRAKVLLYNTQTASPVTTRVRQLAKQAGVPVVGVSETEPLGKSFQQWMLSQLEQLRMALGNKR
jgi:zinc/manganese transport system substrate-binding protein